MSTLTHFGATTATVQRPSWADMAEHYPASDVATATLYDHMIGGSFEGLYGDPAYANTCSVRMSYALNRSGLRLGAAPSPGGHLLGGDGYRYWIRVADLKAYLSRQFEGADEELTLPLIPSALIDDATALAARFDERVALAKAWLEAKLLNRKGIVAFDVVGWRSASGHFTLWDGTSETLAYAAPHDDPGNHDYYFWLTALGERDDGQTLIQVAAVRFWELE